jgi:hypothetical protein
MRKSSIWLAIVLAISGPVNRTMAAMETGVVNYGTTLGSLSFGSGKGTGGKSKRNGEDDG